MNNHNVKIGNDILQVEITSMGAELQSVKLNGKERLWQGDPKFWTGRAPILFPVCGSLKNKEYTFNGKKYGINQHGFARRKMFEVVNVTETSAAFALKSDEETKAVYPFDFTLTACYEVVGEKLRVTYKIHNDGKGEMWAFIGSHEAYAIEKPLDSYDIVFDKDEKFLSRVVVEGGLVSADCDDFGSGKVLQVNDELFKRSTAVFVGINSRKITLRECGKPFVSVEFDASNLLIWQMPGANYICLEPWTNYPDETTAAGNILHKPCVTLIGGGKTYENTHEIEFFD